MHQLAADKNTPSTLIGRIIRQATASLSIILMLSTSGYLQASQDTPPPLEQSYLQLEQKLRALEQHNPTSHQVASMGAAMAINLALEFIHTAGIAASSPDYFYQRAIVSAHDVQHIWRDVLTSTLTQGYLTSLAAMFATWVSENRLALPPMSTVDTLWQLGTISGGMAIGYSLLKWRKTSTDYFSFENHPNPLMAMLQVEARPLFAAAESLNTGKIMLQAAALVTMVCWSFLRRHKKQIEINDLRNSLILARERMLRQNRENTQSHQAAQKSIGDYLADLLTAEELAIPPQPLPEEQVEIPEPEESNPGV